MTLTDVSQATLDFAEELRNRALGNADDQSHCSGAPHRNYEFGILFSQSDAQRSRRGDRSDIRPNSLSIRFEVEDTNAPLKLLIVPSFWVYFRWPDRHTLPSNDAGDLWQPDTVWMAWDSRPIPNNSSQPRQDTSDNLSFYLRTRYCQAYDLTLNNLDSNEERVALDLRQYKNSRANLGNAPNWAGEIQVRTQRLPNGHIEIQVTLENSYESKIRGIGAWYDVRMKLKVDRGIHHIFCPLLETTVHAQTVNCVLVKPDKEQTQSLEVEQVNLAIRSRQRMRPSISFESANWDNVASDISILLQEGSQEHQQLLQDAITSIQRDPIAIRALDIVFETFRRAMQIRAPGGAWHRHQLALLVLGAAQYLDGSNILNALVLNVPTAGGKTEAFAALALWSVAYEALGPEPRWGTAIVKYPTKMLSSDQAQRLTHYILNFDQVLSEEIGETYSHRGIGLFFGADNEDIDRLEVIGTSCPQCGSSWNVESFHNSRPSEFTCPNGHQITVAVHDEIFYRPPNIIVGTIDKFVSKARKTEMGLLLGGGPFYWCPSQEWYTRYPYCWNSESRSPEHEHDAVSHRSLLTALILDEAHLLREEEGSLDAHFETHYLESARELGGRYPVVLVSTATISQASEHCRQLGLSNPILFPSRRRENHSVYYQVDNDNVQHVVLSFMPRGRAIAWALPQLFLDYLEVTDSETPLWEHLKPTLIYCGSYVTRNQTLNAIRRHVDPSRPESTRISEFSRRYFDRVQMREIVENLGHFDAIVTTNIASVGVDLGELNTIIYFGMPYNVNEFIQSMNRTGRQQPAVVCVVHNPYLERDSAFYAYMQPFLERPEELVEAVPLNRFARLALQQTFSAISLAQILHVWAPRMPENVDLRRARQYRQKLGFREARGNTLNEANVIDLLHSTYRSNEDPSEEYPRLVQAEWEGMATNIVSYVPQGRGRPDFPYGDNWLWYVDGIPEPMYQLRMPEPTGFLEFAPDAQELRRSNIQTIYGAEQDQSEDIQEEEIDIRDGALGDPPTDV